MDIRARLVRPKPRSRPISAGYVDNGVRQSPHRVLAPRHPHAVALARKPRCRLRAGAGANPPVRQALVLAAEPR
jgi:hypothetical protein